MTGAMIDARTEPPEPGEDAVQAAGAGAMLPPLQRLPVTLQPDRSLLTYYMLSALLFGPAFFIAVFPFYFRFRTLRYDVEEEGITMRWGILFRREISLAYARIQDIQLSSNVVERWLGLARVQLQTASGSASAEMTIEGIRDVEALRDFFYARMRGASTPREGFTTGLSAPGAVGQLPSGGPSGTSAAVMTGADLADLAATLDAVADEVRALRILMAADRGDDRA
jgi:membrane protein YdbS with pleckstrin-like domain